MTQAGLWWATGAAGVVALVSGVAEWRGSRRHDLDRIGLVPWGTISVLAFLAAMVGLALVLKA